ncbi:MAG: NAD-dependent epimerase/dehydratase family protein [Armatimonadetes bacterium]|nr:NAD-dependent epimerase/dehydratase family protein [Armatimonadota bacterium]
MIAEPALVTGATGFIGRRLVAHLVEWGMAVRALALPQEHTDGLFPASVEVARGDVTDAASVRRAARGVGTVFHLAGVVSDWGEEDLFDRVTVGGTAHTLGAAAEEGARAVLASSVVVYGDDARREVLHEDRPFGRALGPYSRSKQRQEHIATTLARDRGLRVTVMRLTNVYGPGSGPWVTQAVAQLRRGLPALIDGGFGNAALCYVENAARALVLAASTPSAAGRVYNVSDGSDVTWRRYFTDLAHIAGTPPPRSISWPVARAGAFLFEALWRWTRLKGRPPLTHEALNLVGSDLRVPIERAQTELGFAPRVAYEEGIRSVAPSLAIGPRAAR